MTRVTMRDVARAAGVSPTTVAHVLNNTPSAQVAKATRRRIQETARQLGYQRSLLRRSIKAPLRHIGIAVGRPGQEDEEDTAEIGRGIREAALERRYLPVLQSLPAAVGATDADAAVCRMAELYADKLVDGFILDKQCFPNVAVTALSRRGVPLVTVNGSFEATTASGEPIPGVVVDTADVAARAVRHLRELGHRRIALVSRPFFRYAEAYRPNLVRRLVAGYREALAATAVAWDPALFVDANAADRASVAAAADRLFALESPPTAAIAGDDVIAVMLINTLRARGLIVPGAVSVVGCGDHGVAAHLADPPLTTVRTPLAENGRRAALMLIDLLEGRVPEPLQQRLPGSLIIRESTAPPRARTPGDP